MALDEQSSALLEAMASSGVLAFRELGVDGCRRMIAQQSAFARGEPIESVEERLVGAGGTVPVRIFRPSSAPGLPMLVFFHGGGWIMGGLDSHDPTCRALAARAGCVVVSVDYRLAPEHPFPAAVVDAMQATRWVAENAEDLGGDRTRIAVAGDSAGGNLAAVVAQRAGSEGTPLVFQLLIYPVIDRRMDRPSMVENATGFVLERADMEWFWSLYDPDGEAAEDPRAVPLMAADLRGLPPALVITAEHDPLRDEGEEYGSRLRAAGVPVSMSRYPGVFHGFFAMEGFLDAAAAAVEEAAGALRDAFGSATPTR